MKGLARDVEAWAYKRSRKFYYKNDSAWNVERARRVNSGLQARDRYNALGRTFEAGLFFSLSMNRMFGQQFSRTCSHLEA
jgi:hypothetical protein